MPGLSFPRTRNVGRLLLQQDQDRVMPYILGPEVADLGLVADAWGDVRIDSALAGQLVLAVGRMGGQDLSFLGDLPDDALLGVSLRATDTRPDQLQWLGSLAGLRRLWLWQVPELWADWTWLGSLRDLHAASFSGRGVADSILPFLAASTDLQRLDLNGTSVAGTGLAALRSLPLLTDLRLNGVQTLTEEGWASIGTLPHLHTLELTSSWDITELLDLDYDELLRHLGGLEHLERLEIADMPLTGRGYRHLRELPKLRHLNISSPHNTQPTPGDLATLRDIPSLEVLEMESISLGPEALFHLAAIPRLATLNCRQWHLGGAKPLRGHLGLEHLLGAANLRALALDGNFPDEEGARIVGQLTQLDTLSIDGITDNGARQLSGLINLRSLSLGIAEAGGAGVAKLAGLHQLSTFGLGARGLEEWTLRSLLEGLPHLRWLGLNLRVGQSLAGLRGLQPTALESLTLGAKQLQPEWLDFLGAASQLRTLTLILVPLTGPVVEQIAETPALTHLNLTETGVGDAALGPLGTMPTLRSLQLRGNPVSATGLRVLQPLTNLQYFDISNTMVDDEAIPLLLQFPKLTALSCIGNKMTSEGKQRLGTLLPNCTIE